MRTILVFTTSTGTARTEMLAGIRTFAKDTDWNVLPMEFDGTTFRLRELLRFWSPAGCIVEASGDNIRSRSLFTGGFGALPVVYLGSEVAPRGNSCVLHDAAKTAQIAARELLSGKVARYAFVGPRDRVWSNRRKAAFDEAMARHGKSVDSYETPSEMSVSDPTGMVALRKWLIALPKPCGLFAADDATAEGILAICRVSGISVPDDIAVIGVDDNENICNNTVPTLTSVHPDFRQGGRFAARLLMKKILGTKNMPTETLFSTSGLTRRGSTRFVTRKDADVSAALARIHAPDGVFLSAKAILARFRCSRRKAESRFRLATGKSILEELTDVRMSLAERLLTDTSLSVTAIAERCGYRSTARLINAFRARTGTTPLAWKKNIFLSSV